MRLGVTMFATDRSMDPVALARAVEERGLASLYVPEHTHIPVTRRTPPPTGDAELARRVQAHARPARRARRGRRRSPSASCSGPASASSPSASRSSPPRRSRPSTLLSGGRFVFGVGFGWNEDELENHGVTMPERRGRRARARARDAGALAPTTSRRSTASTCTSRRAGRGRSRSAARPAGAHRRRAPGPKLFAHVAEYADGWIPIGGAGVRAALADLHARVRSARAAIRRRCGSCRSGDPRPGQARVLRVARHRGGRAAASPSAPADVVLPLLDRYAGIVTPLETQAGAGWRRDVASRTDWGGGGRSRPSNSPASLTARRGGTPPCAARRPVRCRRTGRVARRSRGSCAASWS